MLFSSFEFIFGFLPVVLVLYFSIQARFWRVLMLLVSSYVFYGFWNPKFLLLLFFSTALDFYLGIRIHETKEPRKRKRLLILSVVVNLGLLGFFKYFNFFLGSFYGMAQWFSPTLQPSFYLDVVLPIGISFYTFISLSYTIDVYEGRCEPHRDFLAYAGFVCYFPHLVAGPLIRHNELVTQLEDPAKGKFHAGHFAAGVFFFTLGLAKKVLLADRLADGVNPLLARLSDLTMIEAWLCALGYTFQLYFDFSGYSDMAVGLAKMMNINFPENFKSPYQSASITEFWQRWHISLSHWLRDYLYIPLGGNRGGAALTYRNLLLTMMIGGLWHGANWVFIAWGTFHGLLLASERLLNPTWVGRFMRSLPRAVPLSGTFVLVVIGWVFFRSSTLAEAALWLAKMAGQGPKWGTQHLLPHFRDRFYAALGVAALLAWAAPNLRSLALERWLRPAVAWGCAFLFLASLAFFSKNSPFLYFQF